MNNLLLTPIARRYDPALESIIARTHDELLLLSRKNAQHHGQRNQPGPNETNLEPYINDLKNGYHRLAAIISKHLQPASHFPEAKMEIDHMKERNRQLVEAMQDKQRLNENVLYELGSFNPKTLLAKIRIGIWVSIIISIGEIMYNTKAFQVIGDNMLIAFVISVSVSVAVYTFAHVIPFFIKAVKKKWHRRLIIFSSLALILGLFTGLSVLRTEYLLAHGEHVSPVYFIIINLFFFVVVALLSYFFLPTWKEVRENHHRIKQYKDIEKRKAEIKQLASEKEHNEAVLKARNMERIHNIHYEKYAVDEVVIMFRENIGVFQSTNLIHRSDRCVPQCFSGVSKDLEIERFEFSFTHSKETQS